MKKGGDDIKEIVDEIREFKCEENGVSHYVCKFLLEKGSRSNGVL
ncbi:hypothetical protein [Priestia megaterium]|nr:hypothetical protein [Priestia megaterium]